MREYDHRWLVYFNGMSVKVVHVMIQITVYVVNEIKTRKITFFLEIIAFIPNIVHLEI